MKFTDGCIFLLALLGFGLIAGAIAYEFSHKEPKVENTITFQNPDEYYMDELSRMERSFQENGLAYLLGPDWKNSQYTVDENPEVQEKLDQLLWKYCLQTSDLFGMVCGYMREQDDHSDKLFDVLFNILYRQNEALQKYASVRMKKDADINTFKYEEESLSSVFNHEIYQQTRLLECLQEMKSKL